jgi:hypothetical protein
MRLQVAEYHAATMEGSRDEARHWQRVARASLEDAKAAVDTARAAAKEHERAADERQAVLLLQQELKMAVASEDLDNVERTQRHRALDEVSSALVKPFVQEELFRSAPSGD